jgi:hypothetical protein
MSVQEKVFELLAKIVKVISLKNILIWSLTALTAIVGYTIFENRVAITNYVVNGPENEAPQISTFTVSDTSKSRIKQLVDTDDQINGVIILNADIRNNRRVPIEWYSDDSSIQKQIDTLFGGKYGGIPLFTSDEKNNENIVGVINGEFACSSFDEGGNGSIFPGLSSRMPFICRTSLPPYYGQFSGYILVTLNRVPTASELDKIKSETLNISTEIYFRDVLPNSRKLSS